MSTLDEQMRDTIGWPIIARSMLRFPEAEYRERIGRATAELRRRGLAGLLMFRQESLYYLTGYDTMGYITFQCMYLGVDGHLALLTRAPDARAVRMTSIVEDVSILPDGAGTDPAAVLKGFLDARAPASGLIGIERDAPGLRASAYLRTEADLGADRLAPADDLVAGLRLVKSPAELSYVRKAGDLADRAMEQALATIAPGISEGALLTAMQGAVFEGGGDYAASRWIVGAGQHSLLVRHFAGHHNIIEPVDQVQLEFGAAYLHYHACLFHTVYVGETSPRQRLLRRTAVEALDAAKDACRPGARVEAMFDAYARVCDGAGLRACRLNACGYSLGATYPPTWMDGNLICTGASTELRPGMVFFPHMVLLDGEAGLTGCAGETLIVTADGCEGLSRIPHTLHVL